MDVEVQAGNQTATSFAQPELWSLLDKLPKASDPRFLRGDCNWGTERAMAGAEQRGITYVLKLKQSALVKRLIAKPFGDDHWVDAGEKWQGLDAELQLSGWSKKRRVLIRSLVSRHLYSANGGAKNSANGELRSPATDDRVDTATSVLCYHIGRA